MAADPDPFDGIPDSDGRVSAADLADPSEDAFVEMCSVATGGEGALRGLFVLGSYDNSVTIYRQQVRAMNLVAALARNRALEGSRVAVIGGGVAGVTAAVAAGLAGAKVSIFERQETWLAVQARGTHRYIHPHLYEWPATGDDLQERSGLPFFDWVADDASRVAHAIREEFDIWSRELDIGRHLRARVIRIVPDGNQWRLGLVFPGVSPPTPFDSVIMTLGFGTERLHEGNPRHDDTAPYWFPDAIERVRHECAEPGPVRVVGGGDGGLIDAVRAAVRSTHRDLFASVFRSSASRQLALAMGEIDEARRTDRRMNSGKAESAEPYLSLQAATDRAIAELELERIASATSVCLVTRGPNPYLLNTALVNRLLVLCLIRRGSIFWSCGEFKGVKRDGAGGHLRVTVSPPLDPHFAASGLAIVRLGPDPRCLDEALPELVGQPFSKTTGGLNSEKLRALRAKHVRLTAAARRFFEATIAARRTPAAGQSPDPPAARREPPLAGESADTVSDRMYQAAPSEAEGAVVAAEPSRSGRTPGDAPRNHPADGVALAPDSAGGDARSSLSALLSAGRSRVRFSSPVLGFDNNKFFRLFAQDGNHGNIDSSDVHGVRLLLDSFEVPVDVIRYLGGDRHVRKTISVPAGLPLFIPWHLIKRPWPDAGSRKLMHIEAAASIFWDGQRWLLETGTS